VIAAEIQSPLLSQKLCSIGWEYSHPHDPRCIS
jgi:hypothetical protein